MIFIIAYSQGCLPHISHCNGDCPDHTRRILCGNSCLTREEARTKYDCGGVCQVGYHHIHLHYTGEEYILVTVIHITNLIYTQMKIIY